MKKMSWMSVAIASLSLLPACGGEDLSELESQMVEPAADNLAQTSNALSVTGNTQLLPAHGGTGGYATRTECPSGYAAVGIHGRSWSYIDRLGLVCRYLNADGSLGATYYAGAAGGFGGADFQIWCPDGQVVVGFQGRSASYVDQLGLYCSTPSAWKSFNASPPYTTSVTGGSGGFYFAETCAKPYVVTSLNLRVGHYVDQEQTVCSYLE
jgi:hypothetical protein